MRPKIVINKLTNRVSDISETIFGCCFEYCSSDRVVVKEEVEDTIRILKPDIERRLLNEIKSIHVEKEWELIHIYLYLYDDNYQSIRAEFGSSDGSERWLYVSLHYRNFLFEFEKYGY